MQVMGINRIGQLGKALLLSGFAVLGLNLGTLNTALAAPNMSSMMNQKMAPTQCQASCTSRSASPVAALGTQREVDKDIEPQPAEPYYIAFIGVGWTTTITVAAAYFLKYLNWRPPDLYKLNMAYRF
jgi:hypothetical protein